MAWTTGFAIYFVAWWVLLFIVLPFGVRSQDEDGEVVPGTDPGAPVMPLLVKKLVWNTIITGVVCGVGFWLYLSHLVTLDDLTTLWGLL